MIRIVWTLFDSPLFDPSGGHYIGFTWRTWYLYGIQCFDWYHPIFRVKRDILMNDSIAFVSDVSSITCARVFRYNKNYPQGRRYRDCIPYKRWQPKQISSVFPDRMPEKRNKAARKKSIEEILRRLRCIWSMAWFSCRRLLSFVVSHGKSCWITEER